MRPRWFTPDVRRILAYSKPVDLRKSIDGLVGLVKSVLEEDPLSESLFVFVNRRGNYVKLVSWDRTGWCLFAKRVEESITNWGLGSQRKLLQSRWHLRIPPLEG